MEPEFAWRTDMEELVLHADHNHDTYEDIMKCNAATQAKITYYVDERVVHSETNDTTNALGETDAKADSAIFYIDYAKKSGENWVNGDQGTYRVTVEWLDADGNVLATTEADYVLETRAQ